MTNITSINKNKIPEIEFVNIDYFMQEGSFGLTMKDLTLELYDTGDNEFCINALKSSQIIDRKKLAEFLWVAATLLDSEERYRPDVDLVGVNYEE